MIHAAIEELGDIAEARDGAARLGVDVCRLKGQPTVALVKIADIAAPVGMQTAGIYLDARGILELRAKLIEAYRHVVAQE